MRKKKKQLYIYNRKNNDKCIWDFIIYSLYYNIFFCYRFIFLFLLLLILIFLIIIIIILLLYTCLYIIYIF
jgi:hypothetical protein